MNAKKAMAAAAIAALLGLGAGCAASDPDMPCRGTWTGRYQARSWPDFTDSEDFLKIAFGGDAESLNRTLDGIVQTTRCEAETFPQALQRFWLLIR
jgi:hypothetical protein